MARPLDTDVVFDAVCEWCRVQVGDVIGKGRSQRLMLARRYIVKILRDNGLTYQGIGDELNRDHSSVIKMMQSQVPGGDLAEIQKFVMEKCNE